MTQIDPQARYTENHEWIRVEGDLARCGVSDHAQDQLSDVVFVELPEVGDSFKQNDPYAVVESVKSASDCFLPVAGEIVEINAAMDDTPEIVNDDPYGEGWFVVIRMADASEMEALMTPEAYAAFVESES